jgi:hypothetical protein
MKRAHVIASPLRAPVRYQPRRRHQPIAWLLAHLRAPWIDLELASGVPAWKSPTHAARALQLTSDRNRRMLAVGLERLVEDAERPASDFRHTAVIRPCREQVRAALPQILAVGLRLRDRAPMDARGVAGLRVLLTDGAGPCYAGIHPDALKDALQTISQWLDTHH